MGGWWLIFQWTGRFDADEVGAGLRWKDSWQVLSRGDIMRLTKARTQNSVDQRVQDAPETKTLINNSPDSFRPQQIFH